MSNLQRGFIFSIFAIAGLSVPARAAGGFARPHPVVAGKTVRRHLATARFGSGQTGTESDPVLLLLFGSGLLGCASLCVVQSHREERRRSTQQTTGNLIRWESA